MAFTRRHGTARWLRRVLVLSSALLVLLSLHRGGGAWLGPAARLAAGPAPPAASPRSGDIKLFIGVMSASGNRDARDAIRRGWASDTALFYRRLFFLAHPPPQLLERVRQEALEAGDLVILHWVGEGYWNLTHQQLEICRVAAADPAVTHVLKADDDVFVRLDRLLPVLGTLPRRRLVWGHIWQRERPIREPRSWWYISPEEWPGEFYPPFASGTANVISADLAREIAAGAALQAGNGTLFKVSDVALGSWLAWIEEQEGERFHRVHDERVNFLGCNDSSDIVSGHKFSPARLRCMWEQGAGCDCGGS